MAQRISSIYRLVTFPAFYEGLQYLLGAEQSRTRYAKEMLRARPGDKVLDVGCGPATILSYLPPVDYMGLDLNAQHIEHAKDVFGDRARFIVGNAATDLRGEKMSFDLIIVSGLLHHLADADARTLLAALCDLLKPDGRIVTCDCVWLPRQNPFAWAMNKLDSGLNVRDEAGYLKLVENLPAHVEPKIYRDFLRIPYDHFCMTLSRTETQPERRN